MYTYEWACNKCDAKLKMEIHKEIDYNMYCPGGAKMELMFFLKSPDVRAGCACGGDCGWPVACGGSK